jgi:hypothetical protein
MKLRHKSCGDKEMPVAQAFLSSEARNAGFIPPAAKTQMTMNNLGYQKTNLDNGERQNPESIESLSEIRR